MMLRSRLSKELRKAIGNSFFAVASAIVIFLLVDSRFDASKSLDTVSVIISSVLVVLMLLCGESFEDEHEAGDTVAVIVVRK